jgi:hypothetical protein
MKNTAILFVLCLMTSGYAYSKTKNARQKSIDLTITLSTDFYSHLLDSVSLRKDTLQWSKSWEYNAADRSIDYHFNNLSKGNYTFFSKDILGLRHSVSFNLSKDTSIRLDDHMGFHPVPIISKEDLQKAAPVYIAYLSSGCFSAFQQTAVLTREKNANKYTVTLWSNWEPQPLFNTQIDPVVFDDLFALQTQSLAIKAQDSSYGISTNHRNMIILAGDKLFHFSDESNPFEWNLCQDFFNKYINQKFSR